MRTYTEAAQEEYDWITETIRDMWNQAFDANKIYDLEVIRLERLARKFHNRLRQGDDFAPDFFHTMESLKAVLGDMGRAIRGEQLPAHIQKMIQEERAAFGFEY